MSDDQWATDTETPTTEEVRYQYLDSWDHYNDEPYGVARDEARGTAFDTWLTEHDRAVADAALVDAIDLIKAQRMTKGNAHARSGFGLAIAVAAERINSLLSQWRDSEHPDRLPISVSTSKDADA